ncbi:MAG TPA: hypothetical protein PKN96_03300 [Flavobacterium sp.]|uniref:hypothetical protein n=1 Tax=Flavobacterium sp. TaxID=239 RepID=UPI002CEA37B5|nr:hypothetical protein [Flavobacterium sp.]HNP32298.1 hypothetical protein [Flavobacterium sp.]
MKRFASTPVYSNFEQEINKNFLNVSDTNFRGKSDFIAMCSQISYLSQEKLPIIYANIRV